jgi:hypothetical protein
MKKAVLLFVSVLAVGSIFVLPPIRQNPHYHDFANHAEHYRIVNFWNVVSNAAFLLVALAGWHALQLGDEAEETWKKTCVRVLLLGIGFTAFGSAYYHWHPSDARLLWDRLPMTIVFMCVFTLTIGERIDARLASRLLWPLLILGIASVFDWRWTGDLRLYAVVQFYPLLAVPLMLLLLPAGATSVPAQWGMIGFYGLAKLAEMFDSTLQNTVPAGAHAWKHLFAATGLLLYTQALIRTSRSDKQTTS